MQYMTSTNIAYGSLEVTNTTVPILKALTDDKSIRSWLSYRPLTLHDYEKVLSQESAQEQVHFEISIKKESDASVIWYCNQNDLKITIHFKIKTKFLEVRLECLNYSILTFLQEWIYRLYRFQDFVENGTVTIPELQYSSEIKKDLTLQIPVKSSESNIFRILTEKHYLSKIFANYPESDLNDFRYSWGWIDEGPSNLISWKENKILIHDFLVDFNPIGYIKWEIENKAENQTFLTLTHKDIYLTDEINPIKAYNSYKYGWMYYLAKIKDLSEHNSFTIHFIDEIIMD